MQIIINSLQRLQNVIPSLSLLRILDGEIYDVVMYPSIPHSLGMINMLSAVLTPHYQSFLSPPRR